MAEIARRDLTRRSYSRFLSKLEEFLLASFPSATNDLFEDHILKVLTELISYAGGQLSFYLDMAFNEVMWDKVGHRRNIVALAKLLGYVPRGISSARVTLDATTDPFVGTLVISKGTVVSSSVSGVPFEVETAVTVTAPDTIFEIDVIQGVTRTDTHYSDGLTIQRYDSIYDQVSASVEPIITVDGTEWTKVPFLWDVLDGQYYELQYIDDQKIRVTFGDGVHGSVPPDTVPITIRYLTSKGSEGNIAEEKISTTISGLVGATPHDVRVVNNERASGGAPEETVEEIRNNAPVYFQSLGVVTTPRDLSGFVEATAGMIKAQVVVDNSTKIVRVYAVAAGYLPPSQAALNALKADIEEILVMGAILGLEGATFPTVDADARFFIKLNYSVEEVIDNVNRALTEYFTPADPAQSEKTIGSFIYRSDFIRLLDEVEGVDHVELDKLTRTPVPDYVVWAVDSGTFRSPIEIGTDSQEETWTVMFTSPTTFEVLGSVSGLQAATGTVGIEYTSDTGRLTFAIEAGASPNQSGDYAEIKTSQYVASVPIGEGEFVLKGTMNFTYNYVS